MSFEFTGRLILFIKINFNLIMRLVPQQRVNHNSYSLLKKSRVKDRVLNLLVWMLLLG